MGQNSITAKLANRPTKPSVRHRRRPGVVVDRNAKLSPFAVQAVRIFSKGVQDAYARLAKRKVATVVVVAGRKIRGVPHLEGDHFVVTQGSVSPGLKHS